MASGENAGISSIDTQMTQIADLKRIVAICRSSTTWDELLARTTQQLATTSFPCYVGFMLIDLSVNQLVPHVSFVVPEGELKPPSLPLDWGIVGKCVSLGKSIRLNDLRRFPDHFPISSSAKSTFCVPVRVQDKVIGVLNAEDSRTDAYSDLDESFLEVVADTVSFALERLECTSRPKEKNGISEVLLNSLSVGVLICDRQQVLFANAYALTILGFDDIDSLRRHTPIMFESDLNSELSSCRLESLFPAEGQSASYELQFIRRNGEHVAVEVQANWVVFNGGACTQVNFSDITERKRVELALRQSQQSLASIAAATPHWIYVFDLDLMGTVYTNRSLLLDLGHPPGSEQAERSIWAFAEYMPESELPHLARLPAEWQLMSDGRFREDEYHLNRGDGSISSFACREVVFARRQDGTVKQILGTLTDITRHKQAEKSLIESERRFRELADAIPQVVWIAGKDGGLTHLNAKATEYSGLEPHDLTGWSWDKVVHPEDLQATVSIWKACLLDGLPRDFTFRIRRADGAYRWHMTRQVPIYDSNGDLTAWYGTCTDIEELKKIEESLQTSESRFRLLFEGAADAILWADAETGIVIQCNRAAEILLNRKRNEIIGQHQSELHPSEHEEHYRAIFQDHLAREIVTPVEVEVVRSDGSRVEVSISPSVTLINGKRVIQGIFRDISQRKRDERTIQKLSEFREAIIRNAAEGICVCFEVPEFPYISFTVWNARMFEITGYSMEEINRLGWYQSLYPDPLVRHAAIQRMNRMRNGDDLHAEEWEIVRKDGEARTISISTSIVELDEDRKAVAALIQDVTLQKQAMKSLQQSEQSLQLFREFVNWTNDTIHIIDPETSRFIDVNERACEKLGYTRTELLQLGVVDIDRSLPDQFSWHQHVREVKKVGSALLEGTHVRKDRTTFPVEVNIRHVTLEDKEYLIAVVRDISERKLSEASQRIAMDELRASEERFTKLFHASPFSIIVASFPGGQIVEANNAFLKLFEFELDEVIGKTTGELDMWVLAEDRQRMLDSLISKGFARNMEYLFQTKSGNKISLLMSVELIRLNGQDYSLAMSIDITDRKFAEAELQRTDELLRAVVKSTTDAVFVKNREGKYLLFNDAAGRLVGQNPASVLGKDDSSVFDEHAVAIVRENDNLVMTSGRVLTLEETLTASGVMRTYLTTKAPYRDQRGEVIGLIGISRDITDRKREEEDRRLLSSQLAQSQKMEAIGRLAGGVAHDFNNILTVINGYSRLLLDLPLRSDQWKNMVFEIAEAGSRAATLTQQLLNYSRKQVINRCDLDMNDVLRKMENLLRQLIGENIYLTIALSPKPAIVLADSGQLSQVVMNLAVNARDAMPSGGTLSIRVNIVKPDSSLLNSFVKHSDFVELAVTDSGVGIHEELIERIFEPFFTTKSVGMGTGLGLASVKAIAEDNGGFVTVTSSPNIGSTFKFYLPAHRIEPSKLPGPSPRASSGSETILLVEDEKAVRGVVRRFLEQYGYSVIDVPTALEAIKIATDSSSKIDLLVTDVVMPEIGGRELVEILRNQWPTMKYLFVSGYSPDEVVRHGVSQAQVPFLQKPFSPNTLAKKIRELLG